MNKRLLKFVKLAKDILKGKRIGDEGSSITALTYASLLNDIYKAISIIFLILGTGLLVSAVKNLSLSFSSLIAFFYISYAHSHLLSILLCILGNE